MRNFRSFIVILFWLLISTSPLLSQTISKNEMEDIVIETANLLKDNYIFPEIGNEYANGLKTLLSNGAFDSLSTGDEFSWQLTNELQAIHQDKHLRILNSAQTKGRFRSSDEASMEEMIRRRVEQEKAQNFYMDKVEVFPGNIGYFRLNQFPFPELAKLRVDAIMQFLQDTDAVVLDLRANPGGVEALNQYISSYFFEEGREDILYNRYYRPGDSTSTVQMLPELPSPRMVDQDLCILVSPFTGSSAENIAYSLQSIGRAIIVGQPTAGAAHSSRILPLPHGFSIQIPIARVSNPYTNESWEGTGVIPDIEIDYNDALLKARELILNKKIELASTPEEKSQLTSYLKDVTNLLTEDSIASEINPDLQNYVGEYGPERKIWIENGALNYQREDSIPLKLEQVEKDLYKLTLPMANARPANELPNVRFDRNSENEVTGLTLVFDDGRVAGQFEKND